VAYLKSLINLFRKNSSTYTELERLINYTFSDYAYLCRAFTHRSVSPDPKYNYERLEFLGDTVIDLIISDELMREFPEGDEGILTKKRSALVQRSFLASMGSILKLLDHFNVEPTVNLQNEKVADKQLANLYESLIGAMFLDGGMKPTKKLVLSTIWANRAEAWKKVNYKGQLIEYCHAKNMDNPKFLITDVSGPDHQKMFEVHVKIGDDVFPSGMGMEKKSAEQSAAEHALESFLS
jgi:ribonuclease-3